MTAFWRVLAVTMGSGPSVAKSVADQLSVAIRDEVLAGGRVEWRTLGTFLARTRKARRIRNPATKRLMRLPAVVSVGLRASKYARRAR